MEYDLEKQGFCILRSAIDEPSLKKYQKEIETFSNKQNVEHVQSLVKHNLLWDYISNKNIINKIESVLGDKILFLNDAGFSHYKNNSNNLSTNTDRISWHRDTDSASPIKGVVPHPSNSDYYKVFTLITYICEKDKTAKINLLPSSHLKKFSYTFRNILRFFHWKTKNKTLYKILRRFIVKFIGHEINLNSGDCLIFCVSLFHMPLPSEGNRSAILSRFGVPGESSSNYLNYILKNSVRGKKHSSNSKKDLENFNNFLKQNNIYSF